MKAKQLQWRKVKPEVFEDFSYNADILILKLNDKPAHYQVNGVNREIGCQLWVGNRAFDIECRVTSIEKGQAICQEHYNLLVTSNAE